MANIKRLDSENKLVAAGPFEGGGGIFIFRSSSKKQVQEWLETDPAVHAKRWDIEMFNYTPRIGSVCAVAEPIEMIQYHFMRYEVNITKYTISKMSEGEKEHEQYIKQLVLNGDVVTEGTFGPDEGNILVMKGDLKKELIELDPSIQKEFFPFRSKVYTSQKEHFAIDNRLSLFRYNDGKLLSIRTDGHPGYALEYIGTRGNGYFIPSRSAARLKIIHFGSVTH